MWRWLRWAQRDRRLAWIMIIDLLLALIIISAAIAILWPAPSPIVTLKPTVVAPTVLVVIPTLNPTRLVSQPNQGQSDAPPPPPADLINKTTP